MGRIRLIGLAGLFWAVLAASLAEAMTNAELLSLCAGERGLIASQTLKKALADGADINFTGPHGLTPLMAFVSAHNEADREALAALKVILAAGPNLEARSDEGGTALGYAILNQAGPRVIAALLEAGADARTPIGPQGGLPPLLLAAGLEPDPLVSALLWADGAGDEFREARSKLLLGQADGRPGVLRLLTGALEAAREEGLPLFTAAPEDSELRADLKELDARLRPPRDEEDAWLDYLQWQIDLPLNLAVRRDFFGRTAAEAWLDEYSFRLASADLEPEPRRPRDRIILPGPRPTGAALEALAVASRQVIVLVYAENLIVAYEKNSGRELWRRRPSGPTRIMPAGPLLLAATAWGGGLGEVMVLEPLTGSVLLTLTDLDNPKWALDAGRRALIISTDLMLDILDLSSWKNRRWSWLDLLGRQSWDEASRSARAKQNTILAEYGESLDEEGRFTRSGGSLFQPAPAPSRAVLDWARAALKAKGHLGEPVPLAAEKNSPPSFVLGSDCPAACGQEEAAESLALVNPLRNRIDVLTVPGPAGAQEPLTRGRLAVSGAEARLLFSPEGAFLAATEKTGAVHLFNARSQGRHLITIQPRAKLAEGLAVSDFNLLALLTDDQPPLALFHDPVEDRHFLAEAGSGGILNSRPLEPGTGLGLTAWAATAAGHWAAGLSDGGLWLLAPGQPAPRLLATHSAETWSALAFSGDGPTLAAASGREIYLFKGGQPGLLKATLAGEVYRLALDKEGRWLWAALTFSGPHPKPGSLEGSFSEGRSALALVDLSAPGQTLYKTTEGLVLALNPKQGGALALIDLSAPGQTPAAESPVPALSPEPDETLDDLEDDSEAQPGEDDPPPRTRTASHWPRGRADLWPFDRLRLAGPKNLYEPDRLFAGLTQAELFHQEISPDRPYVTLSRENLADRRPGRIAANFRLRRLSQAAFDPSGRLAVFPELDGDSFHIINLTSGRAIARGRPGDPEGLLGAAFLKNSSRLFTFGRGGLIQLWSFKEAEPRLLLTWVFAEGGRWEAVTPEGLFDAKLPAESDHILRSVGRGSALPLSHFIEDSLRPGLSAAVPDPLP